MSYLILCVLLILFYFLGSIQGSYVSSRFIYKDEEVVSDWQDYKALHTFTRERVSVVLIDGIKILIPVLIMFIVASHLSMDSHFGALLGGSSATIGHMFPFFKRGKGEAMEAFIITSLFVSLPSALISIGVFVILFAIFGRKTIPFVVSVFAFPVALILFFGPTFETGMMSILYSVLIFWRQKKAVNTFLTE
ncbi:MAG: glycerol-3-phosphate acyltransferase [Candidatus Ornithospirochaeta sp.]